MAGADLVSINNSTVADIAMTSEGRPWGNDDIGAAFQKNYAPLLQQFTEAFGNIARYVEGIGEAAVATVDDNMNADARAGDTIQQAYRT